MYGNAITNNCNDQHHVYSCDSKEMIYKHHQTKWDEIMNSLSKIFSNVSWEDHNQTSQVTDREMQNKKVVVVLQQFPLSQYGDDNQNITENSERNNRNVWICKGLRYPLVHFCFHPAVTFVDEIYNQLKTNWLFVLTDCVFQQMANTIVSIQYIRKYQMYSANKCPLT